MEEHSAPLGTLYRAPPLSGHSTNNSSHSSNTRYLPYGTPINYAEISVADPDPSHIFLGVSDPDPFVRGPDSDPSIIKQN